ncbi:zinc finger protein 706, partial [Pseudochaenichthys georgianus]|uniref:zinc finger protein 706 n=1 Tax=Pseudochaenichthys georgianus TaxID=52239 RepID=UPI00146D5A18
THQYPLAVCELRNSYKLCTPYKRHVGYCYCKEALPEWRRHQKLQSQQKNAKKQTEMKKAKGHDQKTDAKAALVFTCLVCRTQMPDPKTFKQHFESKHPKSPLPPELEGVEA